MKFQRPQFHQQSNDSQETPVHKPRLCAPSYFLIQQSQLNQGSIDLGNMGNSSLSSFQLSTVCLNVFGSRSPIVWTRRILMTILRIVTCPGHAMNTPMVSLLVAVLSVWFSILWCLFLSLQIPFLLLFFPFGFLFFFFCSFLVSSWFWAPLAFNFSRSGLERVRAPFTSLSSVVRAIIFLSLADWIIQVPSTFILLLWSVIIWISWTWVSHQVRVCWPCS